MALSTDQTHPTCFLPEDRQEDSLGIEERPTAETVQQDCSTTSLRALDDLCGCRGGESRQERSFTPSRDSSR